MLGIRHKKNRAISDKSQQKIQIYQKLYNLRSTKSIEECVDIFKDILCQEVVDDSFANAVFEFCAEMRKSGLAMEPNLAGRAICRIAPNNLAAERLTQKFSPSDTDFAEYIGLADRSRDKGDFREAEVFYDKALQLFPSHAGILVQYGHCLKEQGKFLHALVHYLEATSCGSPRGDIYEHAIFAAEKIGRAADIASLMKASSPIIPKRDIISLSELFLGHSPSFEDIANDMIEFRSTARLAKHLVKSDDFKARNSALLRLIFETE